MKTVRVTVVSLLSLLFLFLVGDQLMKRSLRRTNFDPLSDLFKARLAEVVTVPVSEATNLKDRAKLFDTYRTATLAVDAATVLRLGGKMPNTSADLSGLSKDDRLDAWGNPFCLLPIDHRIAAVSAGAPPDAPLRCNDLHIEMDQLQNMPSGKLYKYPSGVLILLGRKQ